MTELRKALERPVADLVFDENRKNAVREKAFTAKRGGSALRRGAAVALVCTVLCVTAVAAGPSLWQYMQARQGPFAGLAQTVEGAVCTSGGIEIQVLSALADDVRGEVYFTVRDVEGDRLDSQLTLHCGADSDLAGRLVEYDSESRTALFAAGLSYYRPQTEGAVGLGTTGGAVPDTLHLAVERLTTRQGELDAGASCAGVTAALLDSLPLGEGDRVVMGVEESGYPASILPGERVVLAPGQTPMPLEGTGDVTISSMGFASDGRFHVRVAYAPGIGHGDLDMGYFLARVYPRDERRTAEEKYSAPCPKRGRGPSWGRCTSTAAMSAPVWTSPGRGASTSRWSTTPRRCWSGRAPWRGGGWITSPSPPLPLLWTATTPAASARRSSRWF